MKYATLATEETPPLPEAVFVGTIQGDGSQSMGCLLEDGTVLTTFHSIYDFKGKQGYFDLSKMEVLFVKRNEVYGYKIKRILHDGSGVLSRYGSSATTFDYARLELEGEPLKDLGPGLKLDQTNHFGSAFVSDPQETIAISGPILRKNKIGAWYSSRQISESKNNAANGGYYHFPQMGTHPTQPGMSGQAVFPAQRSANHRPLYAVHCGRERDSNMRTGFKVSEYLQQLPSLEQFGTITPAASQLFSVPNFDPEANKNSQRRISLARMHEKISAAIDRTDKRLVTHDERKWATVDTRELAAHFPELGAGIFANGVQDHTSTNKTNFFNHSTGWYLCYDKWGQYSTVHNKLGHYVALDRTTSPDGKAPKYHFNNVPPAQKKRNQIG